MEQVRVNAGARLVLLPDAEARKAASEPENKWLWTHAGHALADPAFGPPSLVIDAADDAAAGDFALRRVATSALDTRPLPAGPARRWGVRVDHRHYIVALAPGVHARLLDEPSAARWVRWREPPPDDLGPLHAHVDELRAALLAEGAAAFPAQHDVHCRLLGLEKRESDGAWLWRSDRTQSLHDNGPPPTGFTATTWTELWAEIGSDAATRRTVLAWLGHVRVRAGRSVQAKPGLWLAEAADGTLLAAYEVHDVAARMLPPLFAPRAVSLSTLGGADLRTVVVQQDITRAEPQSIKLELAQAPRGVLRWYIAWIDSAPLPWTGSAADVRAIVASLCANFALAHTADGREHTVDTAALLKTHVGAAMLLAGDTLALAVLAFDELDAPPEATGSLAAEPGVVVPARTRPWEATRHKFVLGAEPAPLPGPVLPALAWRQLVGAALIVLHRGAPPPLPRVQLTPVPRVTEYSSEWLARVRAGPLELPWPAELSAAAPPPPDPPLAVTLYRVWASRRNAAQISVPRAQLETASISALAELGLHRAIDSDLQMALWWPDGLDEPLPIAAYALEGVPVFEVASLSTAFVLWLVQVARNTPATPPDASALRAMAVNMPDATLARVLDAHNDLVAKLRAERSERQLPLWLVQQSNSLDATEAPILTTLERLPAGELRDYIQARIHAYARAVIWLAPPALRHPAREDESADSYAHRLTCDMLQPTIVADALSSVNSIEAARIRTLMTLPIRMFPDHWTLADIYAPMRAGQHSLREFCAAHYWGVNAQYGKLYRLGSTDRRLARAELDPRVPLADLSPQEPVVRVDVEARHRYDEWKRAFIEQIHAAYACPDDFVPVRPLARGAPNLATVVAAIAATPYDLFDNEANMPLAVYRRWARSNPTFDSAVRALYAETADIPLSRDFFAAGAWGVPELAAAARSFIRAYGTVLEQFAERADDAHREAAYKIYAERLADLQEEIRTQTERRAKAARALARIQAPTQPHSPLSSQAATPAVAPAESAFVAALRQWRSELSQHAEPLPVRLIARQAIDPTAAGPADLAPPVAKLIHTVMREVPPAPLRHSTRRRLGDRMAHLVLYTGRLVDNDQTTYTSYVNDKIVDAMGKAEFQTSEITLPAESDVWIDVFRQTHQQLWTETMRVALAELEYPQLVKLFLTQAAPLPAPPVAEWETRTLALLDQLQGDGRFFRPHPREACGMAAALNTLLGSDPDETRDTTSLQRAVWSTRLLALERMPAGASLAWTPAECREMIVQRKTPEMLARVAVRWAVGDFVRRGPAVRNVVPPRVLEQLVLALVFSPAMFDARERHGLDPMLPLRDRLCRKLAAVWRTRPGELFFVLPAADADALLAATVAEAPLTLASLQRMAKRFDLPPELLWRRVILGYELAESVALLDLLDTRDAAELALWVVELDAQVDAAIKTLDAALFAAVDRVALLHVCFAWHVGYLLASDAERRIFVQQRHPDGRLVFDDFCAQVVPMLLRDVYGLVGSVPREPLGAAWERRARELLTGFVGTHAPDAPGLDTLRRAVFADALAAPRVLWRARSINEPMDPSTSLASGAVSCWLGARDVSPLAGINRASDPLHPEGIDTAFNAENADFELDAAHAFYEWRVGLDCFLRPDKARRTRIDEAPLRPATLPTDYAIDLWPRQTARLRQFERWAALGWPQPDHARAEAVWNAPGEYNRDTRASQNSAITGDGDAIEPLDQPTAVLQRLRELLAARIQAALDAVQVAEAERGAGVPVWLADPKGVARRALELRAALAGAPPDNYADAQYVLDEQRVRAVEAGVLLYADYYRRADDARKYTLDRVRTINLADN
jgi:hypothetical protein